ncbi:glycogen synthase GlgA [Iodobacter sp.]|uniref:glycogen synthase GlgA n=1 Tax=Iodobacter sp. TaxID=1915058 RepID=UPI0025F57767|nr:glycogen synthase GlgA [Iodobacter sp.]
MRVLHVCAELFPLLKTGGLADVTGALPLALAQQGCDVRVLLPGFPAILNGLDIQGEVATLNSMAGPIKLLFGHTSTGIAAYVIDSPHCFDRPGSPYLDVGQQPYSDNHLRFALLGWVAAQLASGADPFWQAELVHAHDWHAGLVPAYLVAAGRPAKSVFTVHNLAYQGLFPLAAFASLALPPEYFSVEGLEFHGKISFMKAGLYFCDQISTVSPRYAQEITHDEQGCGLDGLLRTRSADLSGILNGVDEQVWHPHTDPLIAAHYSVDKTQGKAKCKQDVQLRMGLAQVTDQPLFAVVSRLTEQKGLHLVLAALDEITSRGGQFVLLGGGDTQLEDAFKAAAAVNPEQIAVQIGYDEACSHRLMAAADVLLVPSRFEPCGLTQLYALKYGVLPLVRRVGGLADTVVDCSLENLADESATGFVFDDFSVAGLSQGLRRAFILWQRTKDWKTVRRTAMQVDFGWAAAAGQYAALYQKMLLG